MSIAEITDYEMLVNPAGELLFLLPPLDGPCEEPRLYYDGGAHAVLMRGGEQYFLLREIPPALRPRLGFARQVTLRETDASGATLRSYSAEAVFAHDIPALRGYAAG